MRIAMLIDVVGVLLTQTIANPQEIRRRPPRGVPGEALELKVIPGPHRLPTRSVPLQRPASDEFKIPAGKFGLQLSDGTRVIGAPATGWSATIKTSFGVFSIPRSQIRSVTAKQRVVTVILMNGDRVSGTLISKTLRFETAYGSLAIPSTDLVRLSSGNPDVAANQSTAVGSLKAFLKHLANKDYMSAYKHVAPSAKKNGDATVRNVRLDIATFLREISRRRGKSARYTLGKSWTESPRRFRIAVRFDDGDNDVALIVRENGKWFVANPVHLIR